MPFLRLMTVRTVALAVACAMTLAAAAHSPAHAQPDATPRLVGDALPARALPPVPVADAAAFCPRPTGRWWDDVSVRGCIEQLTGRDHTTPVTDIELTWLDLGGLPAYATIDTDALAASLAAYEQRLADEAAAQAAAEAAEQAASRVPTRSSTTRRTVSTRASRQVPTFEQLERMMSECGLSFDDDHGPLGEHPCIASAWERLIDAPTSGAGTPRSGPSEEDLAAERENVVYQACLEHLGSVDILDRAASDAYFDAHARCVDAQVPGYYARWAAQQAEFKAWLAEAERKEKEALARLAVRRERALQEIRDTCPRGGFASPTKYFVSSYDEIEYVITCYDG
jgi:hypothetical protein